MNLHPKIQALLEMRARKAAEEAEEVRRFRRKVGQEILDLAIRQHPVLAELLENGALTYDAEAHMLSGTGLAPIRLGDGEFGNVATFTPATRVSPSEEDKDGWGFSYFNATEDFAEALERAYAAANTEAQDDAEAPELPLYCPFMGGETCLEERCALWVGDLNGGHCVFHSLGDMVDVVRHMNEQGD